RTELQALGPAVADAANAEDLPKASSRAQTKKNAGESSSKAKDGDLIQVTSIEHWSTPDYTRIAIDLEQDVEFQSQGIGNRDRIFFDLKNAYLASVLKGKSFDVDDGLVKKIRVAQYQPGKARIVIETDADATYNASLLLNPPRLIIDVHGDDGDVKSAEASSGATESGMDPGVKVAPAVKTAQAKGSVPKRVVVEADDDPPSEDADSTPRKPAIRIAKTAPSSKVSKRRSTPIASTREAQPTSG